MIDLVDNVRNALVDLGYDATTRRFDGTTEREGVYVRRWPSTITRRYYSRSKCVSYVYQVIVRRLDERRAMAECEEIAELLEGLAVPSANGSYDFNGQQIYTLPQEMELDSASFHAWQALISADITIRKGEVNG